MDPLDKLTITPEMLRRIAELDEFKGRWQAAAELAPERLSALRRVATVESHKPPQSALFEDTRK